MSAECAATTREESTRACHPEPRRRTRDLTGGLGSHELTATIFVTPIFVVRESDFAWSMVRLRGPSFRSDAARDDKQLRRRKLKSAYFFLPSPGR